MKSTLWLWTAATALVCVCLQVSALPYSDTRVVQENSLLSLKRTKPSLSIVNPLDVLRQRIILEMARRQMRENTRQVELNKALLREIGKRSSNMYDGSEYPPDYSYYDRKMYNQRVATDPDRRVPAEDELDAFVDAILRNNYAAGKLQRPRSVTDRQISASGRAIASDSTLDGSSQPDQAQAQPQQQLSSLFNNEPEDRKANGQAPRPGQDIVDETGEADGDHGEQPVSSGSLTDGVSFLEPNHPGPSEFGSRFVYGMYKNRYAN